MKLIDAHTHCGNNKRTKFYDIDDVIKHLAETKAETYGAVSTPTTKRLMEFTNDEASYGFLRFQKICTVQWIRWNREIGRMNMFARLTDAKGFRFTRFTDAKGLRC